MQKGYFDDKIITKLNEAYIQGFGWLTPKQAQSMRESLGYSQENRGLQASLLFHNNDKIEFYNVHYYQFHKTPDGETYLTEGDADIRYVEYREMEQRGYFIRRDVGDFCESGRPRRDCLGYVTVYGTREALRLAMKIFRMIYGEERGKLYFSTSW